MKRAIRTAADLATRALFVGIALPVLWLLEAIRPVRIGALLEDRIGHLATNTELYARFVRAEAASARRSCAKTGR
jgi:hypothetical protein